MNPSILKTDARLSPAPVQIVTAADVPPARAASASREAGSFFGGDADIRIDYSCRLRAEADLEAAT